ncbi:MAG: flagellar biosynthesis protein FlhA [Chromatiales bacterium]|nr:flagellar biosynthesis protein FlhA [Gammaproteobacteria bacterium]MCP5352801.1 flagellar biosynthesis protein FlhA [Chromatiales bacterium]
MTRNPLANLDLSQLSNPQFLLARFQQIISSGLGAPLVLLLMLAMVVLPLPAFMLDALFTFNIALALVITLVSVYTKRPLDFAAFPTILLLVTLMRLALNIASTRVVLINGHEGGAAAGHVIEAFGEFVIGGNFAVGLIVFAILMIINFVVVTKGATRVSEVSARFTLDAMPGKQMAIDADLNAGVIDQDQARKRREEIIQEADFYGAMDGASKFVRGDAVAALMILFINLIGGFAIGMTQHGLDAGQAAETYALLTIGDGLVAQIPGLLLATASGIIVTRVSSEQDMSEAMGAQLFQHPKALFITAGIVGVMGLIPGMPNIAFLSLAALLAWLGKRIVDKANAPEAPVEEPAEMAADPRAAEPKELGWDDVKPVDRVSLEVGFNLIPMVDSKRGGELQSRIKGIRKKLSQDLGFLLPSVHVRDNLQLAGTGYQIMIKGVLAGIGTVMPDRELAINPGQAVGNLQGTKVKDPVFNMDATWITPDQRQQAHAFGYTVVDASTVIATHLNDILARHGHELLGHEEVQKLLDRAAEYMPKLVEDLVPDMLSRRTLVKVLQNLLIDGVPIRDLRTILEALAERAEPGIDSDTLTAAVRTALRRTIVESLAGGADELSVATLDPSLEQLLGNSVAAGGAEMPLEPGLAERLQAVLLELKAKRDMAGEAAVLLVPPPLWNYLARFVRRVVPGLKVISFDEIPDDRNIRIDNIVGSQLVKAA